MRKFWRLRDTLRLATGTQYNIMWKETRDIEQVVDAWECACRTFGDYFTCYMGCYLLIKKSLKLFFKRVIWCIIWVNSLELILSVCEVKKKFESCVKFSWQFSLIVLSTTLISCRFKTWQLYSAFDSVSQVG
jgi:hypothetical protein